MLEINRVIRPCEGDRWHLARRNGYLLPARVNHDVNGANYATSTSRMVRAAIRKSEKGPREMGLDVENTQRQARVNGQRPFQFFDERSIIDNLMFRRSSLELLLGQASAAEIHSRKMKKSLINRTLSIIYCFPSTFSRETKARFGFTANRRCDRLA